MIRIAGRDSQAPYQEVPRPRLFPIPGLPLLVMLGVAAGILALGAQTSDRLLELISAKLKAGVFDDWTLPILLLYYCWCAIVAVLGLLFTMTELTGAGRRHAAHIYQNAWYLWGRHRQAVQDTLRAGEEPVGYMQVDARSLSAPLLIERLYVAFLLYGHWITLRTVDQLAQVDPFLGGQLWLHYGAASALVSLIAVVGCPTSPTFAVVLLAISFVTQVALAVIDPNLTGPAMGLPMGALSACLLVVPFGGLVLSARRAATTALLVATNKGLRRVELQDGDVGAWQKADAPLLMVVTPTASGIRMQVGSNDGRDKLKPFRVGGDGAGATIVEALESQGLHATMKGTDEASGIAGRLGEVPAIGWVILVSLIFLTQKTLLPPLTNRLQLTTVFEAYQREWLDGEPENLQASLSKLLRANPDLGSAQLTLAEILLDEGNGSQALPLLERLIRRRRRCWPRSKLVVRAEELLDRARGKT